MANPRNIPSANGEEIHQPGTPPPQPNAASEDASSPTTSNSGALGSSRPVACNVNWARTSSSRPRDRKLEEELMHDIYPHLSVAFAAIGVLHGLRHEFIGDE